MHLPEIILIVALCAWLLYILICWAWPEERTGVWVDSSEFLDMLLAAELVEIIEMEDA